MSRKRGRISAARRLAHDVLVRVERDGAYADRALEAALSRRPLDVRDKALATELVYGTLRHQIAIDFYLGQLSKKPLRKLKRSIRTALRMGAYQLLETRVATHAAVDETVSLVASGAPHATGFANALMRRLSTLRDNDELPDPTEVLGDPLESLATTTSHPVWLLRELEATLGERQVEAWVGANNVRPPLSLRVNPTRTTRDALRDQLAAVDGIEVEAPELFPDALRVTGGGDVRQLPGFADGLFTIQDQAAQLITHLAAPHAGDTVLDACAAPGGKATHLAELVGESGRVLALDVHAAKTRLIAASADRLGLPQVTVAAGDAAEPVGLADLLQDHGIGQVDIAVIDAPCSGMGTLRRNPELRSRSAESVPLLCHLQDSLLTSVADHVKPGGVLIYAVCTVTEAEGPERLLRFLANHDDYSVARIDDPTLAPFWDELATETGNLPVIRTWTHRHDADSFFAVRLERAG